LYRAPGRAKGFYSADLVLSAAAEIPVVAGISAAALRSDEPQAEYLDADT
jgi:hypothetical protein